MRGLGGGIGLGGMKGMRGMGSLPRPRLGLLDVQKGVGGPSPWSPQTSVKSATLRLWYDGSDVSSLVFNVDGKVETVLDKVTGVAATGFNNAAPATMAFDYNLFRSSGKRCLWWPSATNSFYLQWIRGSFNPRNFGIVQQLLDGTATASATDSDRPGALTFTDGADASANGAFAPVGAAPNGGGWDQYPTTGGKRNGGPSLASGAMTPSLPMSDLFVGENAAASRSIFVLGSNRRFGSRSWQGPIPEVCIYDGVLSADDTAALEGYLAWKWDLNSKLPADHPYFSSPPRG